MRQKKSRWTVVVAKEITQLLSVTLMVGALFFGASTASAFQVKVVDGDGVALGTGFRWLVEEDNTVQKPAGVQHPRSIGVQIHKSYAPVVAEGESISDSADINLPDGRYIVSVRPFDGYTMGAAILAKGQTSATVVVHELPLPTTQVSVLVFQDHGPINNAPDLNVYETGLEGFSIHVHDFGGRVLQDAFGNPLGTEYSITNGVPDLDGDGNPIVSDMGNGILLTDENGELTIKYLPPGKYGILAAVPASQSEEWVQTATIEGTRTIDVWVKPDEPEKFIEGFGPGFYHAFIGFVRASDLPWTNPAHPDYVDRSAETGTITGINRFNHFSRPPRLQGFFAGPTVDGCWIGLNDPVTGQGLYAAPCEDDSSFTITNVPPGTYELVTWDTNLDALFGAHTVVVPPDSGGSEDQVDLGNVLSFRWFGTLKGSVFLDSNENGYEDYPSETGLANHDVLLRFRNGSVYQLQTTDVFGEYEFAEVFPFFKWLVVEVGFGTLKATGMTSVVDFGGPVDPTDPFAIAAGLDTTGWPTEAIGTLHPQPQFKSGTVSYDADTDTYTGVEKVNPNTGNNLSRTETGEVLTEAMLLFLNQTNIIDWGKNNYAPGENGGISGLVIYNVTRPNDDPVFEGQEDYEPGIPFAQVALYLDDDGNGVIDDVDGNGKIQRADADNYPVGNFPGPEDRDKAPKGVFNWGDAVNITWTDSWDESAPSGCIQNIPIINGVPTKECFDNFGTWNQIRPGVFDGGFAFTSYFPNGPTGAEMSPLPESEYIVEAAAPTGYTISREEDKNTDFGETFTPSPLALPYPCVGKLHTVSDYMSFQLDASGQPYSDYAPADLVAPVEAGNDMPLCDMKQVGLVEAQNTGVEFYFQTRVPKAARNVGFVNNDLAAEFDESSPIFGEKASPPGIPIAYRDFAGNEIARVYSDEFGAYNVLLPSMYSNSVPSPSGFAPNMITTVLNDPGPIPDPDNPGQVIIDPHYRPEFAVAPWTWQYTPGQVTYTDTPIVPLAAFATLPDGARVWAEPAYQTPIPASVDRVDPVTGLKTGPLVCDADDELVIKSGIGTGDISGFGLEPGQVDIVDLSTGTAYPLTVTLWSREKIKVTVPQAVLDAAFSEGQLVITRGDVGNESIVAVTLHVWDCVGNPPIIVAQDGSGHFSTIQAAIDDAGTVAGDLVIVRPGIYNENVILHKEIALQGSGAGSDTGANTTTINASTVPRDNLDAWHAKVLAITGADPFGANEAPGIMVLGNSQTTPFTIGEPHAQIDGFHILGAIAGGGIYVASDTDSVEISNNKVTGNQGTFGGGITVGTPDTGTDANNDAIHIHHNHITKNGGVQGGGGINLYTGADLYKIEHNLISANFSRYTGGGINHIGYSDGGQISDNQIIFNEVFFGALLQGAGDGAGIYISGEMIEGDGAGDVTIDANLIQGNLVGSGYGGGVMVWAYNSTNEISESRLTMTNNMIVNNVAGLAGGGVYLEDVAHADIVNNTIVNNDSTASANAAFGAGMLNSTPQVAGVVVGALNATLAALPTDLADVSFVNNIVTGNRSFFNDASLNNSTGGLSAGSNQATVQANTDLDYPDVWDLDVVGTGATVENNLVTTLTRALTAPATTGPVWDFSGNGNVEADSALEDYQFRTAYYNDLVTASVLDEGGNAITVRYTPLDASAGNYHLLPSSDAVDTGQAVPAIATAAIDFDGDTRPNVIEDIGADEYVAPDVAAVTVISPNGGDALASGSTFPVCWEAPAAATNFIVKYSYDGQTWVSIDETATGNCTDWTVPSPTRNEKKVLVKVKGEAGVGGTKVGVDESDATFTIEVAKLLTPNGGVIVNSGDTYNVTWTSNATSAPIANVLIEYRKKTGKPWESVATVPAPGGVDPGTYSWTVPAVNATKTQMQVRISLLDASNNVLAKDSSDADNTIEPALP